MPQGLKSEFKLFSGDTSLIITVNCMNASVSTLTSDLLKTQDSAYQSKMSFNPNQAKQAQEAIFSRRVYRAIHLKIFFSNSKVKLSLIQNHLELTVDSKLSFNEHMGDKTHQTNKCGGLLCKFNNSTTYQLINYL